MLLMVHTCQIICRFRRGHGNKVCKKVSSYLIKVVLGLCQVTNCFKGKLLCTKGPLLPRGKKSLACVLYRNFEGNLFIKIIVKNICLKWDSWCLIWVRSSLLMWSSLAANTEHQTYSFLDIAARNLLKRSLSSEILCSIQNINSCWNKPW